MQEYLNQLRQASNAHIYFVALSGALMIPDMCSGMETADGVTTGQLYKAWVDQHITPRISMLSGEDCWGLRCSLLHQGRMTPHVGRYDRVLFIEPGGYGGVLHNNNISGALNIDVAIFVETMINAAEQWLAVNESNPNYINNSDKYMQKYPNGLPPYIVGVPVIS